MNTQAKSFKATTAQKHAANTLVLAMAYTKTIKPIIRKIDADLLDKFRYKWDLDKVCGTGDRIKRDILEFTERHGEYCKEDKMTYLISDTDFGHYMTERHNEIIKAGFNVDFGYCPLLIAERLERDARKALIDEMEAVTGFNYDQFFNTTKWEEHMNKYITLTLQLLSPYLKNTLKAA